MENVDACPSRDLPVSQYTPNMPEVFLPSVFEVTLKGRRDRPHGARQHASVLGGRGDGEAITLKTQDGGAER